MKGSVLSLLIICLLIASCGSYPCSNATPSISFVAFTPNETDTIIVKRFIKSTNFSSLADSFKVYAGNSTYQRSTDTLEIFFPFGTDNGFLSKYDYQVYLPKNSRRFQISEINEEFRSLKKGLSMDKVGCENFITSYRLDGNLIAGAANYYTFYLHR